MGAFRNRAKAVSAKNSLIFEIDESTRTPEVVVAVPGPSVDVAVVDPVDDWDQVFNCPESSEEEISNVDESEVVGRQVC